MLNTCATRIQSLWRGYQVRKQTSPLLNTIRNQLNQYQANASINNSTLNNIDPNISVTNNGNTLGERIHNSLTILNYPYVSIQQIVLALSDLDTVTRLSPECCRRFAREEAVNILYKFIMNCNRSIPHQDLIKLCLKVFLNLAKYSVTSHVIIDLDEETNNKLNILLTLLQSYQTSNPMIFVYVCVILSLLTQSEQIKLFLSNQAGFIKKLQAIHSLLDRRVQLKQKQTFGGKDLAGAVRKAPTFCFNLSSEWTLSENKLELSDTLHAIEYLCKTLDLIGKKANIAESKVSKNVFITCEKTAKSVTVGNGLKKVAVFKPPVVAIAKKIVTKTKSTEVLVRNCELTKKSTSSTITSTLETEYKEITEENGSASMCCSDLANSSIKSISNFYTNKPNMNSTIIKRNSIKK